MNQIIKSLIDFMNPDLHITPNPLVNVLALTIIDVYYLTNKPF